ncbi:MAG: OprD family outer membrane porin [Sulfuricurvum sp.]|uniref:OprD family outer membrane porin n=1 Tax=Sulfuricurvum sp. TaxID=2025608 RepID=UPI00261B2423|nr:OprD family outer membrane porin [Sulfuricurvum sp.]MDD2837660.1 OprD family outer membrane porin [Sulfuricurvum sp.]MDD3596045.1 OprD family outer membrane porin [Sulfuricurvum sp.]
MNVMKISMAAAAACLLATSAHALKTEDRTLKGNMQVEYTKVPGDVNTVAEMFTKGEVYGRIRSNMFLWDWDNEKLNSTKDHDAWGLGGSLIYKTGFFNGFGATLGFYGTVPLTAENTIGTTNIGKAGKDTYRTAADGSEEAIGVLAEGYLEYKAGKTDLKVGRQIIESTLLASNDTKMVPNTFEAAVVENKDVPDTKLRLGYITQQKLRDHQTFHSILAYQKRVENDDSAGHAGLTPAKIAAAGEDKDPEMIFVTAENKSIKNLKLNADYYNIDGFFSTLVLEANYKIALGSDWSLTPGVRYLRQMDDGAGAIGGAALAGNVTAASAKGYTDPTSVDASMWAARLVLANGPFSLMGGFSKVADDADIIAPWRGFPTGGYTRSMAQYNWMANTKTWMVQAKYDFNKAGLVPGLNVAADYADMNYDDAKMLAGSLKYSDRTIFHVDAIQTFKALPNTEFKLRFATVNADPLLKTPITDTTDYDSYNEYRFEINYMF